jgi:hypothetical protein
MKLLLSDGSSLASRQTAGLLHARGHHIDVLGGRGFGLASMTSTIRTRHDVPRYGDDPLTWLDAAIRIARDGAYDALVPTQEQAAALSAGADQVAAAGIRTAVPRFRSLVQVQDKAFASVTLTRLGIPTPPTTVVDAAALAEWDVFPVFAKRPIGTGSTAVALCATAADLPSLGSDEVLVLQEPAPGPLAMVQTVWCRGQLVAAHVNERVAEGAGGGASRKRSLDRPDVVELMATLGHALDWHGALCADVILSPGGPVVIDVNPRLVEPSNAAASGVDLIGALVEAAFDRSAAQPASQPGVDTHQVLLAMVGAAQHVGTRRRIVAEVASAITRRGDYRNSREELTPLRGDWRSAVLVGAALGALVVTPGAWRWFAQGAVASYALSPTGWSALRARASEE